jgi:DNA-binding response OmpR family regulator
MCEPIGRVTVIEDEQSVREAVLDALRAERFKVAAFADLPHPRDVLAAAPDLVILDVMLPREARFRRCSRSGGCSSTRSTASPRAPAGR